MMRKSLSPSILVATSLLYLQSFLYFAFAVVYFLQNINPVSMDTARIIAVLLFINSILFLTFGFLLTRAGRNVFYSVLVFLILNLVVTIVGEVGTIDLVIISSNLISTVLIIANQRLFLKN